MESPFWSRLRGSVGRSLGQTVSWVIGALVLIGAAYWAYGRFSQDPSKTEVTSDSVSVASAPRPLISGGESVSTSPSGDRERHSVPEEEESRGTVTITDTSESSQNEKTTTVFTLFVRETDPWFPEWGNTRPPVRRIGSGGAVVWTPPPRPLLGLDFSLDFGIGATPTSPAGLHVGASILEIGGRVSVGPFAHVSTDGKISGGLKAGTLVKDNLMISAGITYRKQPAVALTYQF